MANTNKKTIVTYLEEIKEILDTNGLLTEELETFINKRIEVTAKKNASGSNGEKKLTKEQEQNEVYMTEILNSMEIGKSYTITDMMKEFAVCENFPSANKANALVKKLKDRGAVIRTEVKGKAYFTKA